MFESVDPWTDERMNGRRLDSNPISSPAFVSGDLTIKFKTTIKMLLVGNSNALAFVMQRSIG